MRIYHGPSESSVIERLAAMSLTAKPENAGLCQWRLKVGNVMVELSAEHSTGYDRTPTGRFRLTAEWREQNYSTARTWIGFQAIEQTEKEGNDWRVRARAVADMPISDTLWAKFLPKLQEAIRTADDHAQRRENTERLRKDRDELQKERAHWLSKNAPNFKLTDDGLSFQMKAMESPEAQALLIAAHRILFPE